MLWPQRIFCILGNHYLGLIVYWRIRQLSKMYTTISNVCLLFPVVTNGESYQHESPLETRSSYLATKSIVIQKKSTLSYSLTKKQCQN